MHPRLWRSPRGTLGYPRDWGTLGLGTARKAHTQISMGPMLHGKCCGSSWEARRSCRRVDSANCGTALSPMLFRESPIVAPNVRAGTARFRQLSGALLAVGFARDDGPVNESRHGAMQAPGGTSVPPEQGARRKRFRDNPVLAMRVKKGIASRVKELMP